MSSRLFILVGVLCMSALTFANTIKEHADMKGPYPTPQDVTKACIKCHEDQADDFGKSRHWNWEGEEFELHGKKIKLGKKTMMNNYCVNINSNEPRCTSCHAGYGWTDSKFDHSKQENMDCLICHDSTGTYKKFPTDAGYPVYKEKMKKFGPNDKVFNKVDLVKIAQNVKNPTNKNCGACHFNGGGGHAVKQGDLDNSLLKPTPNVDVHMAKGMTCATCHAKKGSHEIKGALHASMAAGANHFSCSDCHEDGHKGGMKQILNKHALSVACETCHIPKIAKEHATKTWWDWTKAGNKKRKTKKDKFGQPDYDWKKGEFKWAKNISPEYYWYTGKTDYYLAGEPIDPTKTLAFNKLEGDFNNPKAKISPFKVMRGKQFYDKKTKALLVPHLFGKGGYWKTLDWNQSFTNGMESIGLKYSGSYDVVKTEMFWPVDHMVVPKNKTLKCNDCHGSKSILDWKALGYPGDPKKTKETRVKKGIVD